MFDDGFDDGVVLRVELVPGSFVIKVGGVQDEAEAAGDQEQPPDEQPAVPDRKHLGPI